MSIMKNPKIKKEEFMAGIQLYTYTEKVKRNPETGCAEMRPWYHVVVCFDRRKDQEKLEKLLKGKTLREIEYALTKSG